MFAGFEGYPNDLAVTATDDTTLEFTLTAPCAYMEDLMAFPTFYPVKQSAVEAADGWETSPGAWCQNAGFVSNGPFVCTEWNHDTSMTYEKNPYWYGADDVELEKMEFMLSAADTAIYAAYHSRVPHCRQPRHLLRCLQCQQRHLRGQDPGAGCLHAQGHEHPDRP